MCFQLFEQKQLAIKSKSVKMLWYCWHNLEAETLRAHYKCSGWCNLSELRHPQAADQAFIDSDRSVKKMLSQDHARGMLDNLLIKMTLVTTSWKCMCFYKTSHSYIDLIRAGEFPSRDLRKIASPWKESAKNWLEVNYFLQGDNWDKAWNNQTMCWMKITVCIQSSLFVPWNKFFLMGRMD